MADPKLKRTTVQINFSCDDGYKADKKFFSKESPEQGMIAAIRELSRMAHLYGYGEQAEASFKEARSAVDEFFKVRKEQK